MPPMSRFAFQACSKLLLLSMSLMASSCSTVRLGMPPIRELYHEDAQRLARNPVIVIHGILGARLEEAQTGKVVWGAFTKDAIDVTNAEGMRTLGLDLARPGQVSDRVLATGPVDKIDVGLLFGIVSVDVYAQILRSLGVGGYSEAIVEGPGYPEDHYSCHTFFYDWRLDNVQNAIALGAFIQRTRQEIDQKARIKLARHRAQGSVEGEAKALELERWLTEGYRFDLVAHSMGGLIARYFLRYGAQDLPLDGSEPELNWAGSEQVDRLVMVATPNLGSMEALEQLLNGLDLGLLLPSFDRALLGSMPSIYQLLPRNANRLFLDESARRYSPDLFDVNVWEANQWGLMDPRCAEPLANMLPEIKDPIERVRIARKYLAWSLERARRFHQALDKDAAQPSPSELRLFAADTIPTLSEAHLNVRGAVPLRPRFLGPELKEPGDGTVTRYSALADRQYGSGRPRTWLDSPIPWSSVTFLPDDHVGLTSNPQFTDNLLFYLLAEKPKRSAAHATAVPGGLD